MRPRSSCWLIAVLPCIAASTSCRLWLLQRWHSTAHFAPHTVQCAAAGSERLSARDEVVVAAAKQMLPLVSDRRCSTAIALASAVSLAAGTHVAASCRPRRCAHEPARAGQGQRTDCQALWCSDLRGGDLHVKQWSDDCAQGQLAVWSTSTRAATAPITDTQNASACALSAECAAFCMLIHDTVH